MMKDLTSSDQIPSSTPVVVRRAVSLCEQIVRDLGPQVGWGKLPTILFQFEQASLGATLNVRYTDIDVGATGTFRATDALNLVVQTAGKVSRPERHRGVALWTEVLETTVEVPSAIPSGDLQRFYHEQVAAGAKLSMRTIGVLSSGWRFEIVREQEHPDLAITLIPPGQHWADDKDVPEVLDLLVELDQHLGARS